MKKYDVVIVGFGPTGGTLANLLALHGFSILVLEKEKSFYPLPRAVHFDDEVMRVFETIGITKTFLKHTIINKGTKFVDKKNRVILDWPRPREITENGWYPSYRFNQPDLERELRKKLKSYKKVEIRQSSNVKKIINKKNDVNITFEDINSKKILNIKSKYLIGCDGANSTTRSQMKTKMNNLGFTQKWAVIDLILNKDKKNLPDRTIQYSNPTRPATYCRNVGKRRRWEFAIKKTEKIETILSDKYIWNFLKPWLKKNEAKMERKTIYTFQSALAKSWKKGRIFLAGDAAHLMPPFMGQGMCAGIRDVSNLAWKISHCLKTEHNDKLLNTYQSERSSNVKEYIETTMRMGEFVNAVGKSAITNNISADSKGRKSMKSIKPKLGHGLGKPKDKFRGNIFPQFKNNGKNLDIKFSKKPILVLSNKFKQSVSKKINFYRNKSNNKLSRYLESINCEGLIVRPDRFVLASIKNLKDVRLVTKRNLKLLI
jgi:3-(3-hydroxy-phenyl)propionate hydroxylase